MQNALKYAIVSLPGHAALVKFHKRVGFKLKDHVRRKLYLDMPGFSLGIKSCIWELEIRSYIQKNWVFTTEDFSDATGGDS